MAASSQVIDGNSLSLDVVRRFEGSGARVVLSDTARERMKRSIDVVREAVRSDRVSYGITTGFGAFANKRISSDQVRQLQLNLIRSHACGVGDPLPSPIVRLMLLLKANALAAGFSGARPEIVEALLALLEHDVLPIVRSRGSVCASGDLAPLAHVSLCLIGEGEALVAGKRVEGQAVCEAAGFAPIT